MVALGSDAAVAAARDTLLEQRDDARTQRLSGLTAFRAEGCY